ncbi:MAG: response regulator [Myxococcaceae bacterium]|nr:response regulator [Myxococcaceae bacterium]
MSEPDQSVTPGPALDQHAREKAELEAQIRRLVQTEHRLTRTRLSLDRQLSRLQSLAEMSLELARDDEPASIVEAGRKILLEALEFDDAVKLSASVGASTLTAPDGTTAAIDPTAMRELESLHGPLIVTAGQHDLESFTTLLAPVIPPLATRAPTAMVILPFRLVAVEHDVSCDTCGAVLVAWTTKTASFHSELPSAEHLSFLTLMLNQLQRAINNALLTKDLMARGDQLASANRQLQASLAELARAQTRIVKSQKLEGMGRLAGGLAHDFNNLLTVILTNAQYAMANGGPAVEEDLTDVIDAAKRAAGISRSLLTFGRRQEGVPVSLDLGAVVTEMSKMLRHLIGEDIALTVDVAPGIPFVMADRTGLEQVLLNLVVNARDAMPGGGKVSVECRWARPDDVEGGSVNVTDFLALSVTDTGTGMTEETRQKLFEPFFTTKPVGQGTGLGLATVYGVVTQANGHIKVKSELGSGSTFTVLFPVAARHVEVSRQGATQVLLVEDEPAIRRVVARVLRGLGVEPIEARDGREALSLAKANGVRYVVTDVVMPSLSGVDMVQQLRTDQADVKVLFMSGHTFERLDQGGLRDDELFLRKPFTSEELERRLQQLLGQPQKHLRSVPALNSAG